MAQKVYRHRPQFRHLLQFRRFRRMPQFRMVAMTRWLNQTVRPSVAPTTTFLSNIATGHLQARSVVDKVTGSLPVPPELVKAIPDVVHAILDPLIGKSDPKAREEPLNVVKHLVPGKTLRAEGAVEAGTDDASEDSSRSGPVRRQAPGASDGESGANLDPDPSAGSPAPRAPSGSGANVGVSSGGDASVCAGVGCSG
jgi:hypothetical protein